MTTTKHRLHPWWLGLGLMGVVLLLAYATTSGWAAAPADSSASLSTTIKAEDESTADHTQFEELQREFENATEVTQACLECHTEAAKQVMASTHWTWEFPGGEDGETWGKKHVINNFCVAVTSNWPRCTSCHVGYGWKDDTFFDTATEAQVDCLICHDTTGTYKKFPTGAGHPAYEPKEFPPGSGKIWEPPDLAYVAQNVGRPSNKNCGACHFYGGGGDGVKHGDMDSTLAAPPKEVDVHLSPEGAGMVCADCHKTEAHQVPGSRYAMTPKDTHGKDLPVSDGNPTTCESCHGLTPMKNPKLNDHVDKVACQTCHIPAFARGDKPTKMWWDWSVAGDKQRGDGGVEKDENGWVTYHYKKGEFVLAKNVVPTYLWFNGKTTYMVEGEKIDPSGDVYINRPQGGPEDPNARIYPFKVFRGKQGYDPVNKVLLIPHLFPFNKEDKTAFWKGFDWGEAFRVGMETAGLDYSGQYDWIETTMYWPITHMVAPAEQALKCNDCHAPNGRLAEVPGVYIPAQTGHPTLDAIGWTLSGLTLLGVVIHAGLRVVNRKRA